MGFRWVFPGALCCALAMAGGAFGAHGLASRLDARSLQLWQTAATYLMYGGIGQALVGVLAAASGPLTRAGTAWALDAAGASLLGGALLFSGTVGALALGGPRWLGVVTPLGGLLLIAGFLLFAWVGLGGAR